MWLIAISEHSCCQGRLETGEKVWLHDTVKRVFTHPQSLTSIQKAQKIWASAKLLWKWPEYWSCPILGCWIYSFSATLQSEILLWRFDTNSFQNIVVALFRQQANFHTMISIVFNEEMYTLFTFYVWYYVIARRQRREQYMTKYSAYSTLWSERSIVTIWYSCQNIVIASFRQDAHLYTLVKLFS